MWKKSFEDVPLDGPARFHCFLDPRIAPGYLAWAVHDGEQVHIGVGGYAARFDPMQALKQFRNSLGDVLDLQRRASLSVAVAAFRWAACCEEIANANGLLVGDAAGAVSPLTAGGLDPCMRLSTFAADTIADYFGSDAAEVLAGYSGDLFRSRFVSRLFMRRAIALVQSAALVEIGCALFQSAALSFHCMAGLLRTRIVSGYEACCRRPERAASTL